MQQGVETAVTAQRRTERFLVQPLFLEWLKEDKDTGREFCILCQVAKRRRTPSYFI